MATGRRGAALPKKASQLGYLGKWNTDFNFHIYCTHPCKLISVKVPTGAVATKNKKVPLLLLIWFSCKTMSCILWLTPHQNKGLHFISGKPAMPVSKPITWHSSQPMTITLRACVLKIIYCPWPRNKQQRSLFPASYCNGKAEKAKQLLTKKYVAWLSKRSS